MIVAASLIACPLLAAIIARLLARSGLPRIKILWLATVFPTALIVFGPITGHFSWRWSGGAGYSPLPILLFGGWAVLGGVTYLSVLAAGAAIR